MKREMRKMNAHDNRSWLKQCGLKNTKHRADVLKALELSSQPVSAEQIYLSLQEKNGDISLSTVYRILELLVSKEIVLKMNSLEGDRALFELNRMVHRHYLVCLGCHKMLPIDDCPLDEYEKQLPCKNGFYATGHSLEIYGYCSDCYRKKTNH